MAETKPKTPDEEEIKQPGALFMVKPRDTSEAYALLMEGLRQLGSCKDAATIMTPVLRYVDGKEKVNPIVLNDIILRAIAAYYDAKDEIPCPECKSLRIEEVPCQDCAPCPDCVDLSLKLGEDVSCKNCALSDTRLTIQLYQLIYGAIFGGIAQENPPK